MDEAEEPFLGESCSRCFLEDAVSFRSPLDNTPRLLCLTETVLENRHALGSSPSLLHLSDVISAKVRSVPLKRGGPAPRSSNNGGGGGGGEEVHRLEVFAYAASGREAGCTGAGRICRKSPRRAAHQSWLVVERDTAEKWATAINDILKTSPLQGGEGGAVAGPGRRLLVLVNPVSGTGGSRSAWEKTLRPMLEQAMVAATPIVSTRGGELAELIATAGVSEGCNRASVEATTDAGTGVRGGSRGVSGLGSLDDFDGIVVVGGDGTFFEVLQGMYARPDCARQLSRLSLGVVPSGTGNGLAKTLSDESGEEFGVVGASFLAAKGSTRKMDLAPTESGSKKYLAFLNVGWGMISDVDIESEAYRWLGSWRFTVGTVVRIAYLKHYKGRISYLPAVPAGAVRSMSACEDAAMPFRMPPLTESIVDPDRGVTEGGVTGGWTTVEGEFVLADMTQTKYISHDMPMAPGSRLGDGLMDLFVVRKGAGRVAMIKMFLAMEKGEHVSPRHPCNEWHRVRAFRIEPLTSRGRLTVDGELVDYAPLQQHVWHKAANIMCSPDPVPPGH